MAGASRRVLMALLGIAGTMVVELAMATNYTVGDSDGWEIGTHFQSWASSNNFTLGDVLIFVYSANHEVLEVNEADFDSCSASNPIEKHTGGNTAITLLTTGKKFFICGVPGHCLSGMKVEIDTLATSSPPDTPPASPPKDASKPPAKSPQAPPPGSNASPPAPTAKPNPPTPEPPIPPSSAYKCSFRVHFSVGFSFVVIMILAL